MEPDMTDQETKHYYSKKFSEIPLDWFPRAKKVFDDSFSYGWIDEAKSAIDEFGLNSWFYKSHFRAGMWIRNQLRGAGMLDKDLPDGNWDDYYVPLLEWWLGYRILC
jgi:hypothetical protein